jgi:hypothetical protein
VRLLGVPPAVAPVVAATATVDAAAAITTARRTQES